MSKTSLLPAVPTTTNLPAGEVVPMPTLPVDATRSNEVPLEEEMSSKAKVGDEDVPTMLTRALFSAAVPIPMRPSLRRVNSVDVAELIIVKAAAELLEVWPCTKTSLERGSEYFPGPTSCAFM